MTSSDIWEGINGIAQLSMAIVVGIGVWVAHMQLSAWRMERRDVRRSEVAEELIAVSMNISDAFKDIRNPFSSIPIEKAGDKLYGYQERYKRLVKYNDLFSELRNAQIRTRAVIGDVEVDEAVATLFSARARVAASIEQFADYVREDETDHDGSMRALIKEWRSDIYGHGGESDALGKKINDATETIERLLSPVARLEQSH